MRLILTSDFPATRNARVVEALGSAGEDLRIAWICAETDASGATFAAAEEQFASLGFTEVELVDIDEDLDEVQIAYLHEYDVVYVGGTDPLRMRYNAHRSGLSGRLRRCAAAGRLIIGDGAGALLLTPNVSLYRLQHESIDAVLATRAAWNALGAVDYELLPHRDRWDATFMDKLREYSARVDNDIVTLADGGAILHGDRTGPTIDGAVTRFRKGNIIEA